MDEPPVAPRPSPHVSLVPDPEYFRILIENATDVITVLEADGCIRYESPSVTSVLGYEQTELVGRNAFELIHPEDVEAIRVVFARAASVPGNWGTGEFRFRHRDGTWRVLNGMGKNLLDDPRVAGVVVSSRDVTQRREAEEELRRSHESLATVINASPVAMVAVDGSDRVVLWNPAAEQLFGWAAGEVTGRPLPTLPPERSEEHRALCAHALSGEGKAPVETQRLNKAGTPIDVSISVAALTAPGQRAGATLAMYTSITERKRAEADLRETNRRLEAALADLRSAEERSSQQERLQSLGTMASGVAHDFNNALTCILGFSELLQASPDALADRPTALRYLQFINTSAKDAASVVNRLRSFYRPREKGDLLVRVDLAQLVEDAVSLTQPRWKAQAEARGVLIEVRRELASLACVEGDPAALREALTNLIFNAVDAMPTGGTITVRLHTEGPHAVLEVADTGTGMTDQVRRHCLEPFFTTKGDRGTGLGLPMVYGVVTRHGGTLEIQSELGVGSSFSLRLPTSPPEGSRVEASMTPSGPERRALSILLVDDQPGVRAVLSEHLRMDGHRVELAADGVEALHRLAQRRYELIIVDRAMPLMGGDELATHVKAFDPGLPVIMVTGFGAMMEAAGEVPPGVDLVVAKPVTAEALRAAIRQVVPRRPSPGAAAEGPPA